MENRGGGIPLLARWTSDFDCGYETNWWYCIKDTPLDIDALKSKRRYEINKGKKNFDVRLIDPVPYVEDIIDIQKKAWDTYPESYRPVSNPEKLRTEIVTWKKFRVFGAFGVQDRRIHAYAYLNENDSWANFTVLKADPQYERLAVNAAMVAGICEYYADRLGKNFYICDGERNTVHETSFQDYLIKYFDFRRAYCKLNLAYRKPCGLFVNMIYPFKKNIEKRKDKAFWNRVNAILSMEQLSRADNGINAVNRMRG